jgi:hypothetical protein
MLLRTADRGRRAQALIRQLLTMARVDSHRDVPSGRPVVLQAVPSGVLLHSDTRCKPSSCNSAPTPPWTPPRRQADDRSRRCPKLREPVDARERGALGTPPQSPTMMLMSNATTTDLPASI